MTVQAGLVAASQSSGKSPELLSEEADMVSRKINLSWPDAALKSSRRPAQKAVFLTYFQYFTKILFFQTRNHHYSVMRGVNCSLRRHVANAVIE